MFAHHKVFQAVPVKFSSSPVDLLCNGLVLCDKCHVFEFFKISPSSLQTAVEAGGGQYLCNPQGFLLFSEIPWRGVCPCTLGIFRVDSLGWALGKIFAQELLYISFVHLEKVEISNTIVPESFW